ncbi:Receptor-mediated endocytosis protein 6 like protein [Lucilia cuprina]|nr:Receptor-mediated endocytosis protein 6 like protein [Lucilia cuprina]
MAKVPSPFAANRKKRHQSNASNESKDLIDFSDFCDDKDLTPPSIAPPEPPVLDIFQDDLVERRDRSTLQRNSGVDGRRNGIMALKGGRESSENDDKREQQQQEQEILLLTNRTSDLNLNDSTENNGNGDPARSTPTNQNPSSSGIMVFSSTAATSSNQKPTKSTGAIPKSISFDASADKAHGPSTSSSARQNRNSSRFLQDPLRANGPTTSNNLTTNSGIFNKLKQGIFKHRRGHKSRHSTATNCDDISQSSRSVSFSNNNSEVSLDIISANIPSCSTATAQERSTGYYDISEDILAKYRRKVSTSSEATNSSTGNGGGAVGGLSAGVAAKDLNGPQNGNQHTSIHDKMLAFNIIKKKIRTVLSKTDLHSGDFRHTTHTNTSPLLTYLQIQLAQAINLQKLQQFILMEELQNDIQKRQSYLQYLMRYRQNLLMIMENIEQYESRLRSESSTCNRYLMAVCMRLFFEKRQDKIAAFQEDFARLTVSDDKIDLIEEFIESLMEELLSVGGILNGMPEWQAVEARMSLERILLQSMYQQVMFPNEDADLSRDTVLSEHIRKLQNVITPSHPALCIPQIYLSEAPWSFAQQELTFISAYKTPREKLQCVIRCISSIMSLLHMSSGRAPAADDILPVLIYVVIYK